MSDAEIINLEEKAKGKAEEASTEATFSFLDRLLNRNYPTEEVVVYLDEAAGYRIQRLEAEQARANGEQANVIQKQLDFQHEKAAASRYIVHLEGISVEEYDATIDAAQAEYPLEFEEKRNPLTFATERFAVESPQREQFFRTLLWSKFIRKVVGPDGSVDSNITPDWVAAFIAHAPVIAQLRVAQAVELLRMTTDWMDTLQDDDFLAKP